MEQHSLWLVGLGALGGLLGQADLLDQGFRWTVRHTWILIGFFGQALFFGRFFVQWIASERHKASVIPRSFWFLSLGGGAVLLVYAIHRKDPVFIAGQLTGLFIYTRNLWFIYRRPSAPQASAAADS